MKRFDILGLPLLCAALATGLAACSDSPPAAPAAPPPPVSQNVHKFSIGAMTGIALRDGGLELPNDNKVLGIGRTPAEVSDLLAAAGLPGDKLNLSIQPLVVRAGGRVMLFDTGAGTNMGEGSGKLAASMAEAGITPDSVTDIFISHMHGDHVGGLIDEAGDPVFPNATVRLSQPEWDAMLALNPASAAALGITRLTELLRTIKLSVAAFKPGAEVLPGMVRAVEVKGHTPGHSAYRIGAGASSLLYIGDSMHHHVVSVQKPEWPILYDSNATTAAASRASLLAELATSGQRIHSVHFPFPGVGRIEKRGEGYAWVAE